MGPKKKLFLLDAYALIFRAYYAFIQRPIRNSKGMNTSAIYGFVNVLEELLRNEKPSHIAVAFDPPSPTFRDHLYKSYKSNREETPDDIKQAIPYIKKILDAYQIPILEVDGFEADDVVGTISQQAKNQGFIVYMMTPDKDFAQLVQEGVYMYKPRRSGNDHEIWGVNEVRENFKVPFPLNVIDVLALWGDASDNVPGAPGIGEKTAKKLISEFGTVENLIEKVESLNPKLKDCIITNREQILLSKKLVTIETNVPIMFEPDKYKRKEILRDDLLSLFKELEFRTLTQRILGGDTKKPDAQGTLFDFTASEEPLLRDISSENINYINITSENQLDEVINELKHAEAVSIALETSGVSMHNSVILGIALAIEPQQAWYINLKNDISNKITTLDKLKIIFDNKNINKVGCRVKFCYQVLKKSGFILSQPFFDIGIGHYLLHPESKHKLHIISENILNYKMISREKLSSKVDSVNDNDLMNCLCEEADISLRLYNILKDQLSEKQLSTLSLTLEMPLIEVLAEMEMSGFNLDTKVLGDYESQLITEIKELENKIYGLAGETFNISSPKQLGTVLFEKLKIASDAKLTRTKQYSTSEDVLVQYKNEHPIIAMILEYRSLTKLASTYVSVLPKLIDNNTLRIHTSFNQTTAATGRLSSVNPNLQNIPIREERGREIRKAFIPAGKDYILLSADYSQIELRLMAHLSNDHQMIDAFLQGSDIHRSTAAKIYKVSEDSVTREMRSNAKTANFGIIYGISSFGLSQRLGISRSDARNLIDTYFTTFPKVKEYMDNCIVQAKSKGFVTTMYNRRRYLPDINSSNAVVRGVAERNAINSPIQGTAADIIKLAMLNIYRRFNNESLQSKMILQVHDELVFDVFGKEINIVKSIVQYEMENVIKLSIPLIVEMGTGKNWLEAH